MNNKLFILLAALVLSGCSSLSNKQAMPILPPAPVLNFPLVSVSDTFPEETLIDTNIYPAKTNVILAWSGIKTLLIQGATNLINPQWFNVAQIVSNNQTNLSVPVTFDNEFFRGVGLTVLSWQFPYTNHIDGYKVHEGTISGVYTNTIDAGLNLFLIKTNLPANAYYAVSSYYLFGTNYVESALSNEVGKTNQSFILHIE